MVWNPVKFLEWRGNMSIARNGQDPYSSVMYIVGRKTIVLVHSILFVLILVSFNNCEAYDRGHELNIYK